MKKMLIAICGIMMSASLMAQPNQMSSGAQLNCTNLSNAEQQFSNQLTATNQMMFCNQFSPAQRSSAMVMAGTVDATGNSMSPDQAVASVAKKNNITPMQQAAPKSQGGGCPVK